MRVHWDDVAWEPVAVGALRWERQRLGRAAGAPLGLSRYRLPAGAQLMPAHVHVDEDEHVVVLAGGGLGWQDGAAYEVHAGDVIRHRPDTHAHTLLAGDDGLEALIFASGSPTGLTRLPRSGITRVGNGVIPPDADPFAAEPALDPPPAAARPDNVRALAEPPADEVRRGRSRLDVRRHQGLSHVTVAPGAEGYPPHCHSADHELFCVLGGSGAVRLGDEEHAVRRGSVVSRPAGTGIAHAFAAGDEGLEYLGYGHRDPRDVAFYPRSGKVSLRGIGVIFRPQPLDYWDGEPS